MALTIEDGSIVADANSYTTLAEIRAYATARGVTLSVTDSVVEAFAIIAMDYLSTLNYKGDLVEADQPQPYPRENVYIDYEEQPDDNVPVNLKKAQMQLVVEQHNGVILMPTTSNQVAFVKKEKIGPIEKEYSEAIAMQIGPAPYMPLVSAYLAALLNGGFKLRAVRA